MSTCAIGASSRRSTSSPGAEVPVAALPGAKTAKYSGPETKRLAGREIALIFERHRPRSARVRGGGLRSGRPRDLPRSLGSQLGHKEWPTPRACSVACSTLSSSAATPKPTSSARRTRRSAGLQRPHQRVAPDADARRFLPCRGERQAYDALSYAYVGDCRFNMAVAARHGGIDGADVRLVGPEVAAALRRCRVDRTGHRVAPPVPASPSPRCRRGCVGRRLRVTPMSGCRWASRRTCGPTA